MVAALLATPPARGDDAKKAASLESKANAGADAGTEAWASFVRDRDSCPDDGLKALLAQYDAAIDLYQKAAELHDSTAANSKLLLLARRTAKIRATLFMREMRKKAEAVEKAKKDEPEKTRPDPEPKSSPPRTEPEPSPEPEPRRFDPKDPATFAIRIAETKQERQANIRKARRFLFDRYFRYLKKGIIRKRCPKCRAHGKVRARRIEGPRIWYEMVDCPYCKARRYFLHPGAAHYAYWLTRTPLARNSTEVRAEHERWLEHNRAHAADLIPIKRLAIKKVDYHGLWAVAEWEETRGKEKTRVRRILIRLGRTWYFYSPKHDAELLKAE
jgi:hypothetical protein